MGVLVCPKDVTDLGANAAIVMGQLRYWLEKAAEGHSRYIVRRSGFKWVAHTREQIGGETGLSQKQVRTALEKLREKGLIIVEQMTFQRAAISHVRLAQTGHQNDEGMDQMGHPTYKETQFKDSGSAAPEQPKEGDDMKVQDILAGASKNTPKSVAPESAAKPADLAAVFRQAWAETHDQFLTPFHAKHLGQLKQIAARCPDGKGGLVIDFAVRNWSDVTVTAKAQQNAFKAPALPDLGFMLTFVQSVVNAYLDFESYDESYLDDEDEVLAPHAMPQPKVQEVKDDDEESASIEDVQKWLDE